jgi:hypothetical protein
LISKFYNCRYPGYDLDLNAEFQPIHVKNGCPDDIPVEMNNFLEFNGHFMDILIGV